MVRNNSMYKQKIRRNIILFPYFNFFRGFRAVAPVFWIYLAQQFGSYAIAMSYLSLGTILMAIFEVPTGILSDKIGRKKTLMLGAFLACFESILYILAFNFGNPHILFVIATIFVALSFSLYSGTDEALAYESVSELKKKHKFHYAQGKFQSFVMSAWAISALIGGILAEFSFLFVFIVQFFAQLTALIFSFYFVEPKKHDEQKNDNSFQHFLKSLNYIIKNRKLRYLSIGRIIDSGFTSLSGEFRQLFLKTIVPMWIIGLARFLRQTLGTISYWFSGKIIDKFNYFKVIFGFTILEKIIGLFAILVENILSPFIFVLSSTLRSPYHIAYAHLTQVEFTQKQRATMGSTISLFTSLLMGIFSVLMGYMADVTSPKIALIAVTLLSLVGAYFYHKALRK